MKEFATIRGNPYMGCEVVMPKSNHARTLFNAVKAGEKLRKILETLKHKDMKKECRIKEINEQIKRLKKEKKELKCDDGSVKVPEFSINDNDGCYFLENRMGGDYCGRAVWLSSKYNWELVQEDEWSKILVPTKK